MSVEQTLSIIKPDGVQKNLIGEIYNRFEKTLSCAVGSAITIHSDAEREYEECQVKIKKMIDVLKY